MGLSFRKSIKVGKNSRVNLSKSGVGFSTGVKGLRFSRTAKGQNQVTASIPGTGISYRKTLGGRKKKDGESVPFYKTGAFAIIAVAVIAVLGVVLYLVLSGKLDPKTIQDVLE